VLRYPPNERQADVVYVFCKSLMFVMSKLKSCSWSDACKSLLGHKPTRRPNGATGRLPRHARKQREHHLSDVYQASRSSPRLVASSHVIVSLMASRLVIDVVLHDATDGLSHLTTGISTNEEDSSSEFTSRIHMKKVPSNYGVTDDAIRATRQPWHVFSPRPARNIGL
jgi:hypothetical protein